MKLSVSLPAEDVEFLDRYAREHHHPSRSAALHNALAALRAGQLASAYEDAFRTWDASEDAEAWDSLSADGLEA
ncbi:ribbon-helix-helix domain-containing protein [Pseudonocardia spinosispora]|uniref:ribbon-helix-helix domain-containing protein n=1 Tax=Pseudonocardia spinosispora TaxID=103441 RepID=UPI000491F803|nr:ribbon-helix-helix domain-containing protein [Pseudonocardia spinosispora]